MSLRQFIAQKIYYEPTHNFARDLTITRETDKSAEEAQFEDDQRNYNPEVKHASQKRRIRIETDNGEYEFVPAFPAVTSARTTFHEKEGDTPDEDEYKWERLWSLQHNRGHTWDDVSTNTARNDATYRRCAAILQQCEIPDRCESVATSRVIHDDLTGFSSHYAGADGACIGFALLELYDDPEEAQESFYADQASDVVPTLNDEDIEALVDYVFRKYGGAS